MPHLTIIGASYPVIEAIAPGPQMLPRPLTSCIDGTMFHSSSAHRNSCRTSTLYRRSVSRWAQDVRRWSAYPPRLSLNADTPARRSRTTSGCEQSQQGNLGSAAHAPDFYVRATAIFEVMLALTFPSLRSEPRCSPMAVFNLRRVPAGNVARDGASGVAARALAA